MTAANEKKRGSGGTNIDFVGIDIYGTSTSSIQGNMGGQLPQKGKNYSMIMECDAKDARSPYYQIAALAAKLVGHGGADLRIRRADKADGIHHILIHLWYSPSMCEIQF